MPGRWQMQQAWGQGSRQRNKLTHGLQQRAVGVLHNFSPLMMRKVRLLLLGNLQCRYGLL